MEWERGVLVSLAVACALACTAERGRVCERQSQCVGDGGGGRFCTNEGHCARECTEDRDCPCGTVCATSCGVCVGIDFDAGTVSRGTCYTASVEVVELRNACQHDLRDLPSLSERVGRSGCAFTPPKNCRVGGFVGGRIEWLDAAAASDGAGDGAAGDAADGGMRDAGGDTGDAGDAGGAGDGATDRPADVGGG